MRLTQYLFLCFSFFCIFTLIGCQKGAGNRITEVEKITHQQLAKLYNDASNKLRAIYIERTGVSTNQSGRVQDETPLSTLLTEEEAIQIVSPLYNPTVSYLSQQYDIDLHEDIPHGDARIAIIGGATLRLEYLENIYNKTVDTLTIETNNVFNRLETDPDFYDCALRALGISAAVELVNSGLNSAAKATIRKKALRKIIMKVALRTLGFIGAAVAIYELGNCMDWW